MKYLQKIGASLLSLIIIISIFAYEVVPAQGAGISLHNSLRSAGDTLTVLPTNLSPSFALFNASVGEIVVITVAQERPTSGGGTFATVSSISDGTANVWHKRFASTLTPGSLGSYNGFEVWWTYVANPLLNATINVTMSSQVDDFNLIVAGYQGFTGTAYQTNPWDSNVSLPASASTNTTNVSATISGISTASTAGMLLVSVASDDFQNTPNTSGVTGLTWLQGGLNNNAINAQQNTLYDNAYTSAYSSASFSIPTSGGPVAPNINTYIMWADALTDQSGTSPVGTSLLTVKYQTIVKGQFIVK